MSNRVIHFEIHASDPERAIRFYETVFGWTFSKWMDEPFSYWGVMTAPEGAEEPGINGGLIKRKGAPPEDGARECLVFCV